MWPDPALRFRIEELVVLYNLEESIRDVYVEGNTDRLVMSVVLPRCGVVGATIRQVDEVAIDAASLGVDGLSDGQRDRVIYLARELDRRCRRDLVSAVACIVDADFDLLLGVTRSERLLLVTDVTALETYALEASVLDKFVRVCLKADRVSGHAIVQELTPVLRALFAVRAVRAEMAVHVAGPQFQKCCAVSNGRLTFDLKRYIQRLLDKAARQLEEDEFMRRVVAVQERLSDDVRRSAHGHDLLELLRYFLAEVLGPRTRYEEDLFAGALLGCLEPGDLCGTGLFEELRQRLARE